MLLLPIALVLCVPASFNFNHPAGWHSASDITRIRQKIASKEEPFAEAAEVLLNDTSLTPQFKPSPASIVCRSCCNVSCCPPDKPACGASDSGGLERDAIASYYLMLRWVATNNTEWADAAQNIIDAWSGKITGFAGHDLMLAVGLYGGHLAQAAELLAFANPSWPLKSRAQKMFRTLV